MTIPSFVGSYQSPDVYVAETTTPLVTPQGVPPQVVAICGPAAGFRTATQAFPLFASASSQLTFTGVFTTAVTGPPPISAPMVKITATGQILSAGTDYSLTVIPDPSGNPFLAITTINRVSTSTSISDGQQVTITYNYADVTYYQPQVFTDPNSVQNAYGPGLLSSAPSTPNASQVANPVTYAAQAAFANGANTLITVALNPSDGTLEQQLISAYGKLMTTYSAAIIVPVFPDDMVPPTGTPEAYTELLAADLDAACESAAAAGYPRIGFMGLPRNYNEANIAPEALAQSVSDKRLVVVYPEQVQVFNPRTNQIFNASGCYLAAALAGILSSLPVNTGLTRQPVSGFSGLTPAEVQAMTPAVMNTLAAAGITVVTVTRSGSLIVRHGLTTDMSAINKREISMVRQSDSLFTSIQVGIESSGLIGGPITSETVATVQGLLTSILEQDIVLGIIQTYSSVSVTQQSYPGGDPTILVCTFTYAPALPLNYITVTYAINLGTGTVSSSATQSAQNTAAA